MVAIDDVEVPAIALTTLAGWLIAEGNTVTLVDLTKQRALGHLFRVRGDGLHHVRIDAERASLLVPPNAWGMTKDDAWSATILAKDTANVVLPWPLWTQGSVPDICCGGQQGRPLRNSRMFERPADQRNGRVAPSSVHRCEISSPCER